MIQPVDNAISRFMGWVKHDWEPKNGTLSHWVRNIAYQPLDRIESAYFNVRYGISNLIAWTPVIWRDRDWDHAYYAQINEFKMRRMAQCINDGARHLGYEKDVKDLLVCAELFKRIGSDSDFQTTVQRSKFFGSNKHCVQPYKEYPKAIARILGRKMLGWWN